jgi:biotin carboxyl carrier protein
MYLVKLADGSEIAVDIRESKTKRGRWEARLEDGTTIALAMKGRNDDGDYVIEVDGNDHVFAVAPNQKGFYLSQDGATEHVDVTHAADVIFDGQVDQVPEVEAEAALRSPITGIMLAIDVEVGQRVSKGDPVLVIEAMKMENTMTAPVDGVVSEILVKPQDTVFVGDPLVRFE